MGGTSPWRNENRSAGRRHGRVACRACERRRCDRGVTQTAPLVGRYLRLERFACARSDAAALFAVLDAPFARRVLPAADAAFFPVRPDRAMRCLLVVAPSSVAPRPDRRKGPLQCSAAVRPGEAGMQSRFTRSETARPVGGRPPLGSVALGSVALSRPCGPGCAPCSASIGPCLDRDDQHAEPRAARRPGVDRARPSYPETQAVASSSSA